MRRMDWIRERAWQQTIAINVVILGAVLTYLGAADGRPVGPLALTGVSLMAIGIGAPLVSQLLRAAREEVEL